MISSEDLRKSLNDVVMCGIREAISRAVAKEIIGVPRAKSQYGLFYSEHAAAIELPDDFENNLPFTGQILGKAFASITSGWLASAAGEREISYQTGYRSGFSDIPKIAEVIWRIPPEFDVQHLQVPAPQGYEGETFRDFCTDSDQPYCWGPWVAKIYMRFHLITNKQGVEKFARRMSDTPKPRKPCANRLTDCVAPHVCVVECAFAAQERFAKMKLQEDSRR